MSKIGTPGFHSGIDEAEYHADRTSLSVSGAKVLLRSPALFRHEQENPVHKDTFDFGSAAHRLVLGVGPEIARLPFADWRSKEARTERDLCRAEGRIPMLDVDYFKVAAMADELSSHTLAMRLLSEGEAEVSAYALDEETGIMRRGRFDWLHPNLLVDYKSAASADPRDLAGRWGVVSKWGYANQASWYTDLARDLGHPAEAFAFIFQEKTAPYQVTVAYIDDADLWQARAQNRSALERFRDCRESGIWPAYVDSSTAVRLSLTEQSYEEEVIA